MEWPALDHQLRSEATRLRRHAAELDALADAFCIDQPLGEQAWQAIRALLNRARG
jgi:hypothetical protein